MRVLERAGLAKIRLTLWFRRLALLCFIAMLAWVPFPLGSAVSWGPGIFEMFVALSWALWAFANLADLSVLVPDRATLWVALGLFGTALGWATIQSLPFGPITWQHPLWIMTHEILHTQIKGAISLNPYRTQGEVLKLLAEGMATWLAFSIARNGRYASILFEACIYIGAIYVLYGFALLLFGWTQPELVYHLRFRSSFMAGPFMMQNSFATYCGLSALAAVSRLVSLGNAAIISDRGVRRFALSLLQFIFGPGALLLAAAVLLTSGVVVSASRGGTAALAIGFLSLALISVFVARRSSGRGAAFLALVLILVPIATFLLLSGDALAARFSETLDAGAPDHVRLALWAAARRMIVSAPWQGLGLGTFQDAYPLYATSVLPYVMDKAHCDYLELAAGTGVPAAVAMVGAPVLLALSCLQGALFRRRREYYAIAAFAASALVAAHSGVDFSLQLPAVSLSYATLLGIGVAQSQRTDPRGSH